MKEMVNFDNFAKSMPMQNDYIGFWGNVAGAVIGVIGALLVGFIAIHAERSWQERRRLQQRYRDHFNQLVDIEVYLNSYITIQVKNARLLKQIAEIEIIGHFFNTLPRTFERDLTGTDRILSRQITDEVVTFQISSELNNQLIEDFVVNYKSFRDLLVPYAIEDRLDGLDKVMLKDQHDGLKKFASSAFVATNNTYDRAIRLLALVQLSANWSKKGFPKDIDIRNKIVNESNLSTRINKLKLHFNDESMFTSL